MAVTTAVRSARTIAPARVAPKCPVSTSRSAREGRGARRRAVQVGLQRHEQRQRARRHPRAQSEADARVRRADRAKAHHMKDAESPVSVLVPVLAAAWCCSAPRSRLSRGPWEQAQRGDIAGHEHRGASIWDPNTHLVRCGARAQLTGAARGHRRRGGHARTAAYPTQLLAERLKRIDFARLQFVRGCTKTHL